MGETSLERQSNFELMRIFAMFLIIGCHFVCNIYPVQTQVFLNDVVIALYFPGGQVGVALFFILTGFFGESSVPKPRKIAKIVAELFFYAWLSLIIYALAKYFSFYDFPRLSRKELTECLVDAVIPYSSGTWWFLTAYIPLIIVKDKINILLNKLNTHGFLILLFALWFFWYSVANGYKGILSYFAFEKAVFFYIMGFFVRKKIEPGNAFFLRKPVSLFLGLLFYLAASYFQILYTSSYAFPFPRIFLYAAQGAVCVPFSALFLFLFFARLNVGNSRIINKIASTMLGAYIFHRSNIMINLFFMKIFCGTELYAKSHFFLTLTVSILAVLSICSAVDFARAKIVEPLVMRMFSAFAEKAKKTLSNQ